MTLITIMCVNCYMRWDSTKPSTCVCPRKPEAPIHEDVDNPDYWAKPAKAQAPGAREWWISPLYGRIDQHPPSSNQSHSLDATKSVHVIEFAAYSALERELAVIKHERPAYGEAIQQLTQARAELAAMTEKFERNSIAAGDYSIALDQARAELAEAKQFNQECHHRIDALVEALRIIASHDYAGIATADAHITLAREALKKYGE